MHAGGEASQGVRRPAQSRARSGHLRLAVRKEDKVPPARVRARQRHISVLPPHGKSARRRGESSSRASRVAWSPASEPLVATRRQLNCALLGWVPVLEAPASRASGQSIMLKESKL